MTQIEIFLEKEIHPHEKSVGKRETGELPKSLELKMRKNARKWYLFAANFPSELGGGGLSTKS